MREGTLDNRFQTSNDCLTPWQSKEHVEAVWFCPAFCPDLWVTHGTAVSVVTNSIQLIHKGKICVVQFNVILCLPIMQQNLDTFSMPPGFLKYFLHRSRHLNSKSESENVNFRQFPSHYWNITISYKINNTKIKNWPCL